MPKPEITKCWRITVLLDNNIIQIEWFDRWLSFSKIKRSCTVKIWDWRTMHFIQMLLNLIVSRKNILLKMKWDFFKLATLFFVAAAQQLFALLLCESLALFPPVFLYFFFCGASPSFLQSVLSSWSPCKWSLTAAWDGPLGWNAHFESTLTGK